MTQATLPIWLLKEVVETLIAGEIKYEKQKIMESKLVSSTHAIK